MIRCCLLVLCLALVSCREGASPADSGQSGTKSVLTTFYPTTYFAQRIAGDLVEVGCPLPQGADPIFWMPDAGAMQQYQAADLVIINGATFEQWVNKVTLPSSRVVDTAKGLGEGLVNEGLVKYEQATTHRHGPEGEHTHEGIDGHTWVDPLNALAQAEVIAEALTKRWPEHAASFSEGLDSLAVDLRALDGRFRAFADAWGKRVLLASHPAYNYLAKRYGLVITNLELDPEAVDEMDFREVEIHQVSVMLWESEPKKEIAARMAAMGLRNVLVTPGEGFPESGEDYLSLMRANLDRLEALLVD